MIGSLAAALLGCLPAYAQEIPELAGGPGSRAAEQEVARQIAAQNKAAADKLKADQAKLAQQADAQKAEQVRLAKQAEDLKAREASLNARAAELAAEERRLAEIETDQKSSNTATLADLIRETDEAGREKELRSQQAADRSTDADDLGAADASDGDREARVGADDDPAAQPGVRRVFPARLDFDTAFQSCSRAAEDEARDRNFYSARYDAEPTLYEYEGWELRGWMRLSDRRGYVRVRTVCELDHAGEVQYFAFLR